MSERVRVADLELAAVLLEDVAERAAEETDAAAAMRVVRWLRREAARRADRH